MNQRTSFIISLLESADIHVNGSRPWDICVHDERVFDRTLAQGSLGFGEAYMDGWWDCEALDEMLTRVFASDIDRRVRNWRTALHVLAARARNAQRKSKAFEIGKKHYDVGNDLYKAMLDPRMTYTCGYWKEATDLATAQEAKLDLVCKKIGLTSGMRVLDIGCGWGSFAIYAAQKYDVEVVGVTVSKEQVALTTQRGEGLPVEFRLQDYRDVTGTFDRIVSLGMFEHVGYKNYRTYMEVAHRLLSNEGLFLLHTIGGNRSVHATDPWIEKCIFPNSMLPSIAQIGSSIEGLFVMEDWHNFGTDYDKTLQCWYKNFEAAWPGLADHYGERFHRMWRFYLLSSAATFRARNNQLWQVVLSKGGIKDGYQSIR
ncbi:MAG: cyclopropane fatty acyl phospholipid synthase [Candidatus Uhrbacteria bacterium]|nr:cyclopropane fatty acyl phospholipid synthase [Candidatus Uhrbacteria bacterium]